MAILGLSFLCALCVVGSAQAEHRPGGLRDASGTDLQTFAVEQHQFQTPFRGKDDDFSSDPSSRILLKKKRALARKNVSVKLSRHQAGSSNFPFQRPSQGMEDDDSSAPSSHVFLREKPTLVRVRDVIVKLSLYYAEFTNFPSSPEFAGIPLPDLGDGPHCSKGFRFYHSGISPPSA
jgi:hypothetical protein